MRTFTARLGLLVFAGVLLVTTAAPRATAADGGATATEPDHSAPAEPAGEAGLSNAAVTIELALPAMTNGPGLEAQPPATPGSPGAPATSAPANPSAETPPPAFLPPATADARTGTNELRLNFRGAPIEMVLNYLSDAAGFIITLNTTVKGNVDVWSAQPVTKDEAVELLNSVLNKNGYAAIRNGRTLTIMSKDEAIHGDIPVRVSNDPASIPKNDEVVTQIIPIRFVEAAQLVKDIAPLMSAHATILANEAGNAIVITDTQANIRHMAEVIRAIDSSAEDVTEVRVFHLKHHDPIEIANLLTGLFSDQGAASGNQNPIRFGGPGGFGGFGGGPGGGFARFMAANAAPAAGGNTPADRIKKHSRVVAVPDPRTASVVVTAAKDLIGQIAGMIEQLDQESPKVARVSVIHLENADPQQVQQVLQDMFQTSTTSRNASTATSPLMSRIQQNTGTMTIGSALGGSGPGGGRTGGGVPSF